MTWQKWNEQNLLEGIYYETVFVDSNDCICVTKVDKNNQLWQEQGYTVLAIRPVKAYAIPVKNPESGSSRVTRYWNWVTGKPWPESITAAPNSGLPYFKIEIETVPPYRIFYSLQGTEYFNKLQPAQDFNCVKTEIDLKNNLSYYQL